MAADLKKLPCAYELISEEYIADIQSEAYLLRHKKTGARVAVLANDDENKVFSISFRTPPTDSTGVAHIMEHSVLCGSARFPAKDPFTELSKSSLNTFLNAITYHDKTVYPVASCNDKDFQNLMHVYLDAVFQPNIYAREEIFKQEGWHYELTDREEPIIYNGVVYNEMKGAFSSPDEVLLRKITETLYPDTIYSVESGGDPKVIPQLSYEQFLDFHRRYYHPCNSYIYLYGKMDFNEKLDFMDREYLQNFEALQVDSSIGWQEAFLEPVVCRGEYPIGDGDKEENAAYMAYSWSIGSSLDAKLYMAFQILQYVLIDAPGAVLKQALLDRELGEDIYGSFETSMRQPFLSIIIKNTDAERQEEIKAVIDAELQRLIDGGLSHTSLAGTLNYFEFKAREQDFGQWPKGLLYGLQMMHSWLYDDNQPFIHLKFQKLYDELNENLEKNYFEQLIRNYLLENKHASIYVMCPSKGLTLRQEEETKKELAAYKEQLSEEEIEALIAQTEALKAYQSKPTPKEILEMIPTLSVSDIRKESEPFNNTLIKEEDVEILHHEMDTCEVAYVNLLFDVGHIPANEVPYLGILSEMLGNMDTDHYTYQALNDAVNTYTGGMRTTINAYEQSENETYRPMFEFCGKAFYNKLPKLFALYEEMLVHTHFEDEKRLKEILNQLKSRLEMGLLGNGHSTAVNRATSYFHEAAWHKELTGGIAFYHFVCDTLENYDERKAEVAQKVRSICRKIFRKEYLLADVTADAKGRDMCKPYIVEIGRKLYDEPLSERERERVSVGVCPKKNEAFITAGTVQFNACAGDFKKKGLAYHGSLHVMRNILGNDFLWNNVREKGGAYGCMCGFGLNGNGYLTSYRDPKLSETYEIYEKAADYMRHLKLDERELTKYIIGAIGRLDTPMTVSMKGTRSLAAYLVGRSWEEMQKNRDELLGTTVEQLQKLADVVEAIVEADCFCVVGSESRIMQAQERFEHISQLLR